MVIIGQVFPGFVSEYYRNTVI